MFDKRAKISLLSNIQLKRNNQSDNSIIVGAI